MESNGTSIFVVIFIQLVTASVVYADFLGWFKHKYGG